jgi:hypothetical protein
MSSTQQELARHAFTLILFAQAALAGIAQTTSQRAAVQLSATVQASPARITLSWTSVPSTTSITIFRKALSATSWGTAIATPAATDLSYQDNSVASGTAYEYRVVRVAGGVTGTGYISTGIAVPPVDYQGRMILLVDNTYSTALANELATLQQDLRMDGWSVVRSDLARTASVASVKSTILGHYNADPANTKAVFIVGHLAVPYSGNQAPDGHNEHSGAWPCDGYYGELNGAWTDNSVNNSNPTRTENRNVPGDGKFDQSDYPSALELQVGRIDFFNMPAFAANETELTRAYLNKLHAFKVKQWTPTARGLVFDNLQWTNYPLAASAWRSMAPLVGAANITAANQNATTFKDLVNNQSYLFAYGSGAGGMVSDGGQLSYNSADRVGTTQDFASSVANGAVFSMSFGSYFGDWDNRNNFLRAFIASGNGLVSCWSAIPGWYFHHMGMGATVGQSALATMNNNGLYTPLHDGWQGSIGRVHLALMGDPSLRLKMLLPPSNLTVTNAGGYPSFTWQQSPEAVDGYHLYSIDASTGAITRITSSPVTGASFTATAVPYVAGREYMVRAVRLITEPSGSYHNLSLGASAIAPASAAPDCQGVVGGSAVPGSPCNDGNACTVNDTWNASCQCVGTSSAPAATITAGGATSFCAGGSVTLSANTGTGLTYQWRNNGTNISGATASTYTASTSGSYTVVVSSGGCSTTSTAVTVTVTSAPAATITAGGATSFCAGGSVTLSANTGTGLTYQWRNNGANISGATASSYTASASGSYTVVVSNGGCSTTSAATTVSVTSAPAATITAGGATSFCSGGSVTLSANTGTGLTYQWRNNGTNISGATASTYTASASGSYTVVVSSGGCSTTSAATIVSATSAPGATITAGGATSFCSGGSVTLSANTGTGLTYQWRNNGTNISGATASTYTASASSSYTVVVSNGGCSTTSAATSVTVTSAPAATITAGGATSFCSGGSVTLSANTGTGLTYQWRNNGTNISGATASTYTASASGSYTVAVSGGGCSTTSAAVPVTVTSPPAATIANGTTASYCTGSSVTLNANTGTGLTYQWRRNGTAISGATSASHAASTTGSYTVVVSNGGCSSTSAATTVSSLATPTVTCSSSPSTSTVSAAATGGAAPYAYSWSTSPAQSSATATVTASGSYSVTVTGANGCSATCSTSITLAASCTTPRTVTQGAWGQAPTASNMAGYLAANWSAAFPAPNHLTVGCGSRIVRFTTASAVDAALPSTGTAALLPAGTTVNPGASISNTLLGHLAALKISVRMDEIDPGFCASGTLLKDMVIASGTFGGWTVQQLINHADQSAGGCVAQHALTVIASALANINNGYGNGGAGNGYLVCPTTFGLALQETGEAAGLMEEEAMPSVFPNPTSAETSVTIPAVNHDARVNVELLSLAGARLMTLFSGQMEAGVPLRVNWQASALPQGAYLCRVVVGEQAHHLRVIVQ